MLGIQNFPLFAIQNTGGGLRIRTPNGLIDFWKLNYFSFFPKLRLWGEKKWVADFKSRRKLFLKKKSI